MSNITLLPCQFRKLGRSGDFSWMLRRSKYQDVLFVFNDNQEQFEAFHNGNQELAGKPGGGNAIIRPYQYTDPPRAAGIPTGSNSKGYQNLETAKPYIDKAINSIQELIITGRYKRLAYSCEEDGRTLGTSIFAPSDEVKEYIVASLENLLPHESKSSFGNKN